MGVAEPDDGARRLWALSPDKARGLVMDLCDESSFLKDTPMGKVMDASDEA